MLKSLILKEWLKTRRIFFVLALLMIFVAIYCTMKVNAMIEARGIVQLWLAMLYKDVNLLGLTKWLPLLCGMAIGVAQTVPEMSHSRLKLTLHLPVPRARLILTMLVFGICELLVIFIFQLAVIAIYYNSIIDGSMLSWVIVTLIPRYLAGLAAYLWTTAIVFEGRWSRRMLLLTLGVVNIMFFYQNSDNMGAYSGWPLVVLVLFIPMIALLTFGSIIRFKEGLRD